jgi:hypothetical protein
MHINIHSRVPYLAFHAYQMPTKRWCLHIGDACHQPASASAGVHEPVVTPQVDQESAPMDEKQLAIDYNKLFDQFGTRGIDDVILERFEKLTR